MITVYISIGNSDDKLSQDQWSQFVLEASLAIGDQAPTRHGDWRSPSCSPWQNACWCVEVAEGRAPRLKRLLAILARKYGQDSIAWAVASTEFIGAAE